MDELELLLQESVNLQTEKKKVAEAQKRRKQVFGVTASERAEDAERIAAWEAAHVWRSEAAVARFLEQECLHCGDCQYLFSGLLERQSSRTAQRMDRAKRWIAVDTINPDLPKETMLVRREVDFCMECVEEHGFDLGKAQWESGLPVEWAQAPVELPADQMPPIDQLLTLAAPVYNPERSEEAHAI